MPIEPTLFPARLIGAMFSCWECSDGTWTVLSTETREVAGQHLTPLSRDEYHHLTHAEAVDIVTAILTS